MVLRRLSSYAAALVAFGLAGCPDGQEQTLYIPPRPTPAVEVVPVPPSYIPPRPTGQPSLEGLAGSHPASGSSASSGYNPSSTETPRVQVQDAQPIADFETRIRNAFMALNEAVTQGRYDQFRACVGDFDVLPSEVSYLVHGTPVTTAQQYEVFVRGVFGVFQRSGGMTLQRVETAPNLLSGQGHIRVGFSYGSNRGGGLVPLSLRDQPRAPIVFFLQ